jgi:hypothetical protein
MPTAWLNVPHLLQNNDGYCLPACASMVLAYWQNPISLSHILAHLPASTVHFMGTRPQHPLILQPLRQPVD